MTFFDARRHENVVAAIAPFLTHRRLMEHLLLSALPLNWCTVTGKVAVRGGDVVLIIRELVAGVSRFHRSLAVLLVRQGLRMDEASASP